MVSIIIVNIWRGVAFAMIMFQAALEDVPVELIEAARIDGARALQVFRYVTLPLIRGPVFLYLLLTTISTVGVFGLVYFLTQGGPGGADATRGDLHLRARPAVRADRHRQRRLDDPAGDRAGARPRLRAAREGRGVR